MKFPSEIQEKLKCYVYLYIDPRNNKIFYIGKGKGNRVLHHLDEASDTAKVNRIKAIRKAELEPKIELLRFGLSMEEANLLEATAIDLLGKRNLSNLARGLKSSSFGRTPVEEIIAWYKAKPVKIKHRIILIIINRLYYYGINRKELYEVTRGVWKVGPRRNQVEYAFAVFRGIVREVYRISSWYRAGTTEMKYREKIPKVHYKGRWEFVGRVASQDLRNYYIGKSVRKYIRVGSRNPIRYINV